MIEARRAAGGEAQAELFRLVTAAHAAPWADERLSRAERVELFLESLPVTVGPLAGSRFRLRPWQAEIVRGVYAERDGVRLCRRALVTMARGGGKTGLAVGLALAHLLGPEAEPRGECIAAARTRDQASILFREVEAMILAEPALAARCNIQRFRREIEVLSGPGVGSRLAVIAADARSAHGLNPSFVVYDELAQARDRELFDALTTALGKRASPLLIVISTQAEGDEHVMSELVDHGLKVNAGDVDDPRFRAFIWTAPEGCAVDDPAAWAAANPGLGDLVNAEHIAAMATEAKRLPSAEAGFRRFHLNQRVSTREQFLASAEWRACADPSLTAESLRGRRCVGGLDLSATRDLSALALVFDVDGRLAALPYFWLPRAALAADHYRGVPADAWARAGMIEPIEGRAIDPAVIARRVAELASEYEIERIGYDRWRIEDFRRELAAIGCSVELVPIGAGFKDMAPAVDAFERAVLDRRLAHPDVAPLNWNVSNVTVERDAAGNRKPSKRREAERIDGAVALMIGLAARGREEAAAVPFILAEGPVFL